jgi:hypothetical protein
MFRKIQATIERKLCNLKGHFKAGSSDEEATGLEAGRYTVRIPAHARHFSFLKNLRTSSGAQQGFYSVRTEIFSTSEKTLYLLQR